MADRIEVGFKVGIRDALGEKTRKRIIDNLGLPVDKVATIEVYTVTGDIDAAGLEQAAAGPLSDPVIQEYSINRPLAKNFDWLIEVGCNATMVLFSLYEKDMETVISHPIACVVSDGWITSPKAGGRPHPRGYGTFPRLLGKYVREKRLMSLEEAVRKITSMPAAIIGLKDRGMVREGVKADLVVFDPSAIRDKATFDDPHQFPEGIDMVVVNGRPAVKKGSLTGVRPGMVLRG